MTDFDWIAIAKEILALTNEKIEESFCHYMQEFMMHGSAACLIQDDNGFWAIAEEGTQNCCVGGKPMDLHTTHSVEAKLFSRTISGAMRIWAEDTLKDD